MSIGVYVGRALSWVIRPRVSIIMRVSLIRSFFRRSMTIPQTRTGRLCCGNTEKLALVGTCPFEAADDLVAFRNLLLDGEDDVGKAGAHRAKDIFQAVK